MLKIEDKHSTYHIQHADGDDAACYWLLCRRVNEGYWYDNWDDGDPDNQWKDRANQIVVDRDHAAAREFIIRERADFEYEDVQEITDELVRDITLEQP